MPAAGGGGGERGGAEEAEEAEASGAPAQCVAAQPPPRGGVSASRCAEWTLAVCLPHLPAAASRVNLLRVQRQRGGPLSCWVLCMEDFVVQLLSSASLNLSKCRRSESVWSMRARSYSLQNIISQKLHTVSRHRHESPLPSGTSQARTFHRSRKVPNLHSICKFYQFGNPCI